MAKLLSTIYIVTALVCILFFKSLFLILFGVNILFFILYLAFFVFYIYIIFILTFLFLLLFF